MNVMTIIDRALKLEKELEEMRKKDEWYDEEIKRVQEARKKLKEESW